MIWYTLIWIISLDAIRADFIVRYGTVSFAITSLIRFAQILRNNRSLGSIVLFVSWSTWEVIDMRRHRHENQIDAKWELLKYTYCYEYEDKPVFQTLKGKCKQKTKSIPRERTHSLASFFQYLFGFDFIFLLSSCVKIKNKIVINR